MSSNWTSISHAEDGRSPAYIAERIAVPRWQSSLAIKAECSIIREIGSIHAS